MATVRTTVREWSMPETTKIIGEPPGPDAQVSRISRGEFRRQDLRVVTPIYKAQPLTTNIPGGGTSVHVKSEMNINSDSASQDPDYKVEKERESFKLHIIDPKIEGGHYRSNSPMFHNLPAYLRKRNKTPDFPSAHSKRSFLKVDPLENKRLRSYETKIISPQQYLTESVHRHRAVSMSPLRDRLNLRDKDINLPWDPAAYPGPRKPDTTLRQPLIETSTTTVKKTEILKDLDELSKRRQGLFDRSKNRSALNVRELRKVDPDYIDLPERESFEESQVDYSCTRSSKSFGRDRDLYRSQSVMSNEWENYDKNVSKARSQTNLASWQFNSASFSPRSVINVNGHQNDTGLLKIRTDLSPAPSKIPVQLQQQPYVQRSNAGVQTQTKTEQVTSTVVNQQQPPYWNMPGGVMPQIVFVPVATTATSSAPNTLTRETVKEEKIRYFRDHDVYPSDTDSKQGTLIRIKDESVKKPPAATKTHRRHHHLIRHEKRGYESEGFDDNLAEKENLSKQVAIRQPKIIPEPVLEPKVTETVSTVEETTRTEEVERRVKADKKHKQHRSKHHQRSHERYLDDGGGYQQQGRIGFQQNGHATGGADYQSWATGEPRPAITGPNAYQPSVTESYHRHTATKKYHDGEDGGTLRSKYENGGSGQDRFHRSYSSTNVYHNDYPPERHLRYEDSRPTVEYPPSVMRETGGGGNTATMDDRYYNRHGSRHLGKHGRRSGSEFESASQITNQRTAPSNEYRDPLFMPLQPGGNVNEREFRKEAIPGGHETFSRTLKSQSGLKDDGTQFSESKREVNVRRETSEKRH